MEQSGRKKKKPIIDTLSIKFVATPEKRWSKASNDFLTNHKKRREQLALRKTPKQSLQMRDLRKVPKTPGITPPRALLAEMYSIYNKAFIFIDVDKDGDTALVKTDNILEREREGKLVDIFDSKNSKQLNRILTQYFGIKEKPENQKFWKELVKVHYVYLYKLFSGSVPLRIFKKHDWRAYYLWVRSTMLTLSSNFNRSVGFQFDSLTRERGKPPMWGDFEVVSSAMEMPPIVKPHYTYRSLRIKYNEPIEHSFYKEQVTSRTTQISIILNIFTHDSIKLGIHWEPNFMFIDPVTGIKKFTKSLSVSSLKFVNSPFKDIISNILNAPTTKMASDPLTGRYRTKFNFTNPEIVDKYTKSMKINFYLDGRDTRLFSLGKKLHRELGDNNQPLFHPHLLNNVFKNVGFGSFKVTIYPSFKPFPTIDGWPGFILEITDVVINWRIDKIFLILLFGDIVAEVGSEQLIPGNFTLTDDDLSRTGGPLLEIWRKALRERTAFIERKMLNMTSQLPSPLFKQAHARFSQEIKKRESRIDRIHKSKIVKNLSNLFDDSENATDNYYNSLSETEQMEPVLSTTTVIEFPIITTIQNTANNLDNDEQGRKLREKTEQTNIKTFINLEHACSQHICYECGTHNIEYEADHCNNFGLMERAYFCSTTCYVKACVEINK